MKLQVVGAGLPRTGTRSLKQALEHLLGGRCYHMTVIPGHPFNLGEDWNRALAGNAPDWDQPFNGYIAALDWPASMFWRELSEANPEALVLLSMRDTAETWWQSIDKTILPYARMALAPEWNEGRGLSGSARALYRDKGLGQCGNDDGGLRAAQCRGEEDHSTTSSAGVARRRGMGANLPRARHTRA